jgi:hypothetical protein
MAAGITASKRSPLRTHRGSSGPVEPEGVLHSLIVMRGDLVDQQKRGQAGDMDSGTVLEDELEDGEGTLGC